MPDNWPDAGDLSKQFTNGLYQIQAQIIRGVGGWASSVGVPTFYVTADCAVQAVRKAQKILNPFGTDKVSGTVIKDDNYLAF